MARIDQSWGEQDFVNVVVQIKGKSVVNMWPKMDQDEVLAQLKDEGINKHVGDKPIEKLSMWQVVCLILLCSITGCANKIEDKGLEICITWEDTHNKLRLDLELLVKRGGDCRAINAIDFKSVSVKSYFIQRDNDASAMWYQYKLRVLSLKMTSHFVFSCEAK